MTNYHSKLRVAEAYLHLLKCQVSLLSELQMWGFSEEESSHIVGVEVEMTTDKIPEQHLERLKENRATIAKAYDNLARVESLDYE